VIVTKSRNFPIKHPTCRSTCGSFGAQWRGTGRRRAPKIACRTRVAVARLQRRVGIYWNPPTGCSHAMVAPTIDTGNVSHGEHDFPSFFEKVIRNPGKAARRHAQRKILPLRKTGRNVFRIGIALNPVLLIPMHYGARASADRSMR
jgi:hypothetical protein